MNHPIVESMVRSIGSIVVERHSYSMNVVLDSIVVVVVDDRLVEPVLFRATMNCHRLENLKQEQKKKIQIQISISRKPNDDDWRKCRLNRPGHNAGFTPAG